MATEEKNQQILNSLKELGSATAAELSVINGVAVSSIKEVMSRAMEEDPSIRCIRGKGYVWSGDDPTKHPEGHKDLTPYYAMMNEVSESRFTDGAVYAKTYGVTGVVGECGLFLVLKGFESTVCGFDVYTTEHKYFDKAKHITFDYGNREYYIQPERVISISPSKLQDCQFYLLMDKITEIKTAVICRLGLDPKFVALPAIDQSGAISYLKDSGWLKMHDDAVFEQAKKQVESYMLEQPQPIQQEEQPELEWIKREDVLKREASIWKEAFYAVCGK